MATPNYGYEKRQKELAKKRKKEDKLKAKASRKAGEPADGDTQQDDGAPADETAGQAGHTPDAPAQP